MNPYARHADDTADFGLDPAYVDPDAADAALAGVPSAEVDLAEDPFADDLSQRLDAVAPRPWANRTTVALAGLVLLVGGFVAGAQVEKHWGTPASGSPRTNSPFANGTNPNALGAGRGAFGGTGTGGTGATGSSSGSGTAGTTGTVKLVDGTTVYLTTPDGQTVIVKTTPSTAVNVNQAGSLKDLAPGATVTIQGQTASDGSVNATSITKTK
jgi:hypothetical protein